MGYQYDCITPCNRPANSAKKSAYGPARGKEDVFGLLNHIILKAFIFMHRGQNNSLEKGTTLVSYTHFHYTLY
jgi:hypothetical protein